MAFSSAAFVFAFLPAVWLAHCAIPGIRGKNALLLLASLIFYAVSSLRQLPLLLFAALVCHGSSVLFERFPRRRRAVLLGALVLELGTLAVFKYLDFLAEILSGLLRLELPRPGLTLPVGISFYVFQAVSCTVDRYRESERTPPEGESALPAPRLSETALYLAFFPQLIAGPIVKYRDVAALFRRRRAAPADMARGCRRFILGLSKKLLLADLLAPAVDAVYAQNALGDFRLAFVGMLCYCLQIYFDFSGYSDMAIGMGAMFGFRFPENFDLPYAAASVRDFWRRWHISLSSWFRDYLYIPLGGSRGSLGRTCRNLLLVFLLTGLWHGASWTFVLWGLWHGLWCVLERATPLGRLSGRLPGRLLTLLAVFLGFGLFRAESLGQAGAMFASLFTGFGFSREASLLLREALSRRVLAAAAVGILLSAGPQRKLWERGKRFLAPLSYPCALGLLGLCFLRLASASFNPFIYFQF